MSALHELYFEESGNPEGKPVVFLHGGPGGGTDPKMRRFFDPRRYRIVLFDQRGCGKSTPHASLEDNTTWDLVADIEKLREHLGIERWQVFGGSWGSTLALAYAQTHPERVTELVLRGIFLLRRSELEWFYQSSEGAASLFPDLWEKFVAPIPRSRALRHDARLLPAPDQQRHGASAMPPRAPGRSGKAPPATCAPVAADLAKFKRCRLSPPPSRASSATTSSTAASSTARTSCCATCRMIRNIPGVIVQGRYDVVCPMRSAWHLHRAWPEAKLVVVPDAGHSAFEPGNAQGTAPGHRRFRASLVRGPLAVYFFLRQNLSAARPSGSITPRPPICARRLSSVVTTRAASPGRFSRRRQLRRAARTSTVQLLPAVLHSLRSRVIANVRGLSRPTAQVGARFHLRGLSTAALCACAAHVPRPPVRR